jgi:hypothetical protein
LILNWQTMKETQDFKCPRCCYQIGVTYTQDTYNYLASISELPAQAVSSVPLL